jgi:hypothetical protein
MNFDRANRSETLILTDIPALNQPIHQLMAPKTSFRHKKQRQFIDIADERTF